MACQYFSISANRSTAEALQHQRKKIIYSESPSLQTLTDSAMDMDQLMSATVPFVRLSPKIVKLFLSAIHIAEDVKKTHKKQNRNQKINKDEYCKKAKVTLRMGWNRIT